MSYFSDAAVRLANQLNGLDPSYAGRVLVADRFTGRLIRANGSAGPLVLATDGRLPPGEADRLLARGRTPVRVRHGHHSPHDAQSWLDHGGA